MLVHPITDVQLSANLPHLVHEHRRAPCISGVRAARFLHVSDCLPQFVVHFLEKSLPPNQPCLPLSHPEFRIQCNDGSGSMRGPGRSREMYHSLLVASPRNNGGRWLGSGQSGVWRNKENPGADSRALGVNSVSEITALTRRRVGAYLHQAEALATNFGKRKGRRKRSRSEHSPRTSLRLRCSEKAGAGFRQEPTPAFDERGSYLIVGNKCLLLEVTAKT